MMIGKVKHGKYVSFIPSAGIAIDRFTVRKSYRNSADRSLLSSKSYFNTEKTTRLGISLNSAIKYDVTPKKHNYIFLEANANINLYCPIYGLQLGFQKCL